MPKKLGEKSLLFFILAVGYLLLRWLLKSPNPQTANLAEKKKRNGKRFKIIVLILAIFGLLIQISSFFIDKSDKAPELQQIFFIDYFNAKRGIDTVLYKQSVLDRNKETKTARLSVDEVGFLELSGIGSEFILEELKRQNPPGTYIPPIKISSINYGGGINVDGDNKSSTIAFHAMGISKPMTPFFVSITEINRKIETEKDRKLFIYSLLLFAIGFSFQVFSLIASFLNAD